MVALHLSFHLCRVMGRSFTAVQRFMRAIGLTTSGAAGEGCTTRAEMSMRERGRRIRTTERAASAMVRKICSLKK